MHRRLVLLLTLLLSISTYLYAGDVASFVNLGFSPDAETFMFAQYGIDSADSEPFAELYAVDVAANEFESNGVKTSSYNVNLEPGMDGSGALFTLLGEHASLVERYDIDHLNPGRIVYLLVDGEEPKSHIEFRDFNTGNSYEIDLHQTQRGSEESPRAKFHIELNVNYDDGTERDLTVGRPDYFREGVSRYRISHVYLGPNEQSLVFVVQKETVEETGTVVRYMVETVHL